MNQDEINKQKENFLDELRDNLCMYYIPHGSKNYTHDPECVLCSGSLGTDVDEALEKAFDKGFELSKNMNNETRRNKQTE